MVDNPASFLKYVIVAVLGISVTIAYTGPLLSRLSEDFEEKPRIFLTTDRIIRASGEIIAVKL